MRAGGEAEAVDVLVVGAGPAGLIAACAFASAGRSVRLIDPAAPVTSEADPDADRRSTAFLAPARAPLEAAGLWQPLGAHATPLQVMRIVDAGGSEPAARLTADFVAAELGRTPFGWNVPNWLIRREAVARLAALEGARFTPGLALASLTLREDAALATLSDGSRVVARLVVGADGRDSAVSRLAGIGARTLRFGQKALAFTVTHPRPHANVSTEVHRSGGPFTLVPLPDRDGLPSSAVIWMERGPEALRLAALPEAAFAAEATARSAGVAGPLTLASPRQLWPIIGRIADSFTAQRVALMAEAAHVVPPIGAQGLNMSLGDLDALLRLTAGADPGAPAGLARYGRERRPEAALRLAGIAGLNGLAMALPRPLRDARAAGLAALSRVGPLRRLAMRAGLGAVR